jgi:hypothetical protein
VTPAELAALISSIAVLVTALGTTVATFRVLRTSRETRAVVEDTKVAVRETHVMVNSERTNREIYQAELIDALRQAGVRVPKDKSTG